MKMFGHKLMAKAGLTGLEIAPGLFFAGAEHAFDPDPATADTALEEIAEFGLSLVSMVLVALTLLKVVSLKVFLHKYPRMLLIIRQ